MRRGCCSSRSNACALRIRFSCARRSRRSAWRKGARSWRFGAWASASSFELEGDLFLVLHLMIAGRLRWRDRGRAGFPARSASRRSISDAARCCSPRPASKRRASLHVVARRESAGRARSRRPRGARARRSRRSRERAHAREPHAQARAHRPAYLQRHRQRVLGRDPARRAAVAAEADEQARPTRRCARLHTAATRDAATSGSNGCATRPAASFPEKVTAFREGMAVHGRYRQPCPVCGAPVQRIVYAENEANYCATCQTGGRLLADRALSRLLQGRLAEDR